MTTAQHMFALIGARAARAALLLTCSVVALSGCVQQRYVTPTATLPAHPAPGGAIWAVAPLRNESGVSVVNELVLTDTLIAELSQAPGLVVLPLNRTIAGMRALGIPSVDTPAQARELARVLGAQAVIVGAVTAWNPYDPPVLGLNLALFDGEGPDGEHDFTGYDDPMALRGSPSDGSRNRQVEMQRPLAVMAAVFDASDGLTRDAVRAYGTGRHDPSSALGWKQFTASMALYAKFACFEASRRLLVSELARVNNRDARAETTNDR